MCGGTLQANRIEYDHTIPLQLGGDSSLENCQVLCSVCHRHKTAKEDVPTIAHVKRIRDRRIGVKKRSGFRGWRTFGGKVVWNDKR